MTEEFKTELTQRKYETAVDLLKSAKHYHVEDEIIIGIAKNNGISDEDIEDILNTK